jgi:hypothetical protein
MAKTQAVAIGAMESTQTGPHRPSVCATRLRVVHEKSLVSVAAWVLFIVSNLFNGDFLRKEGNQGRHATGP